MKNYIYRFKNEKQEVIYIGKTTHLENRINRHNHLDPGCYNEVKTVEYITLKTIDDMDLAERYLIAKHKPKYNTVYKYTYITLIIDSIDNINWNVLENHRFIDHEEQFIPREFKGKVVSKSFKLYEPVHKRFLEFCNKHNKHNKYKVQDIFCTLLMEALEKYE
ncbi:MAG: GIY-YIG nuclease family protein [Bacilli bacterium]|nr:GIY-YIG nuclease family protein [Bacilli bacterium]